MKKSELKGLVEKVINEAYRQPEDKVRDADMAMEDLMQFFESNKTKLIAKAGSYQEKFHRGNLAEALEKMMDLLERVVKKG